MALPSGIGRSTLYLNDPHQYIQTRPLAKSFDSSIHNCACRRVKAGLILYPEDSQMRTLILLLCEQCYNYRPENGSRHLQLAKWYFNIYKDWKSFCAQSRFSQNEDGSCRFHSATVHTDEVFNIQERDLENWEREAIEMVVANKSKTNTALNALT